MKITKNLKNATFEYDEETKSFTISGADELYSTVELNKVYAFAFMRFVIRMAQRNWLRQTKKPKKVLDKLEENMLSSKDNKDANLQEEFILESDLLNKKIVRILDS
tara:strand:- start:77 stop:394 length:318 start_codon:yes stop_codon:yes gene_type:complete